MRKLLGILSIAGCCVAADKTTAQEVNERLGQAQAVIQEIMKIEDKGIPKDLMARANCVAIIPGVKKAAFIVGAKYGKGFLTCREAGATGWSAPANMRVEGGSVGFQAGASETDLVLLVLNKSGADRLMKSEFKIGGEAAVAAGPVGRQANAETDITMKAEMLAYSRSRGVFGGISLDGTTLREDLGDNEALYGSRLTTEEIVRNNKTKTPTAAVPLLTTLSSYSRIEKH